MNLSLSFLFPDFIGTLQLHKNQISFTILIFSLKKYVMSLFLLLIFSIIKQVW